MPTAPTTFFESSPGEPDVRGFLHTPSGPPKDGLILTHGAGADCRTQLLTLLAEAFCEAGLTVLRCDLPFRQLRPHGPPPRGNAERDQRGLARAATLMKQTVPGRIFLGGHSYGGRQASMLTAAEPAVAQALLLLSYPLHPPLKPEQMRTEHFAQLKTPALFVHGSRDGFATREELTRALELIPAKTQLLEIEKAGHELLTRTNREELAQKVVRTFLEFV